MSDNPTCPLVEVFYLNPVTSEVVLVRGKDRLVCRLFEEDKSQTPLLLPPSPMKNFHLTACVKVKKFRSINALVYHHSSENRWNTNSLRHLKALLRKGSMHE